MTDPAERPGCELLFSALAADGKITGMVVFNDQLYVATERRVFRKDGDRLIPLRFVEDQ